MTSLVTQPVQRVCLHLSRLIGGFRPGYALLLVSILMLATIPTSVAQQIVITESESRPVIDSRRDAITYTSENTDFGHPDNAALQALAGQNGGAQLWDLSIFTYGDGSPITMFFRDFTAAIPGFTIPAYQMANCVGEMTAALNPDLPSDNYAYFFIGNNRLEQYGNLTSGFVRIEQAPGDLERLYPVEFGQAWASNFTRTVIGGPGGALTISINSAVDGWGVLRLPGGMADVPALRIMETVQIIGSAFSEPRIRFVTESGVSATIGYDIGFGVYESVSYTTEVITGGGSELCGGPGGSSDSFVLLVVDDALNLSAADQAARDLLVSLGLMVVIRNDNEVTTGDAAGKDLIVISGSSDAALIAADWKATAVPIVSWEGDFFDDLELTGDVSGTDHGMTAATASLSVVAAGHPIANGASGDFVVSNGAFPMNFGVPTGGAQVVATADVGQATLFTYESSALLDDGSAAPARRVAFYMDPDGPANATEDGMILFRNSILWALGREGEISMAVASEPDASTSPVLYALDQNYPNPFNPSTIIPFTIADSGPVRLTIFDSLGRRIAVLVDGVVPAGSHTAEFRADNLPSGLYMYRLQSAGTTTSRRMMMVK